MSIPTKSHFLSVYISFPHTEPAVYVPHEALGTNDLDGLRDERADGESICFFGVTSRAQPGLAPRLFLLLSLRFRFKFHVQIPLYAAPAATAVDIFFSPQIPLVTFFPLSSLFLKLPFR